MKPASVKIIFILFTCICMGIVQESTAQFKISAIIRPRSEFRNGFKTLPSQESKPAFFVEQRSRLNLDYSAVKYKIGFSLQDVRIWGSVPQTNKTDGLTSVHEAWGEYKFTPKFSIKVGRQELDYDDARILGNLDWAAQARSHDALKFVYQDSTLALHAGAAFNQDSRIAESAKLFNTYYDPALTNYKHLHYLWFKKSWQLVDVSLLALNNGLQAADSSMHFTQTMGGNAAFRSAFFRFDGTGYYQTGKDKSGTNVNAYLLSLALSYTHLKNTTFTIGGDIISGANKYNTTNRAFDPLYGTHHKFYGFMDYFYVGNPHKQPGSSFNTGLVDLFIKTGIKPNDKLSLNIHAHRFSSQASILDVSDNGQIINAYLGTEIDAFFVYNLSKDINLQGGYSQMLASPTMELIKGGDKNKCTNWAWLMLTFKPTLFSSDSK